MKLTTTCLLLIIVMLKMSAQYQAGHMSINFKDASRTGGYAISGGIQMPGTGRDIGTEIYYPAATAGNNVAVATGTFPVVVIGHGFAMDWSSYDNIYNRLASLGYIVALPRTEGSLSPTHAEFGNDLRLLGSLLQGLNTSTVSGTTTFNGKVSPNTAIGGHSMGAGCSYLAAAGNTTITCLFNAAAATTNPSSVSSASLVTVPTLLLSGQRDCVADTTVQNSHYNAQASTKKFHVILKDLTHCDFGNGSNFNCTFGQGTSGCSNTISNTLAFRRYMNYLEPFLAYHLKNNCSEGIRFMDSIQAPSATRVGRKITGTIAAALTVTISGASAVCPGGSMTLTASGANTYTWTGGIQNGIAFVPSSSQVYSVTASTAAGCSKTFTVAVTVNPNPVISVASSASVLCTGQAATLTASGASSYTWAAGPATSINVVTPASNTTYTVTGTDANGCSTTTVITQNVTACTTGLNTLVENAFRIYPNPASAHVKIASGQVSGDVRVEIFDLAGKLVDSMNLSLQQSSNAEIGISHLSAGTYVFKIHSALGEHVYHLVKH
jgi:pimeloyl-ACP methyl ester carboxylesterase